MNKKSEMQDFLKVEKLNQDQCNSGIAKAEKVMEESKKSTAKTKELISKMKIQLGDNTPKIIVPNQSTSYVNRKTVNLKSWDEIVNESNAVYQNDIYFEDLLTENEFKNAYCYLNEIDMQFSKMTGFKKVDWLFLSTAIALQCVRQYILDPYMKGHRPNASSNDEKGRKNNAEPGWYYADTDKILISKVPFDAQYYSDNKTVIGFLKGGNHRIVTLGHDPILGWIFGTANIMTNTITRYDFKSAHIKNVPGKGNTIHCLADTERIFVTCKDRILYEGMDGKLAVGSAVIREAIHLKSDIGTKLSLPIPGLSVIASPRFVNKLADWGIDTAGVSTEMAMSSIINMLIAMVHRLFYDEKVDDAKLFEVRTRKILLYSNAIASTSNVIAACIIKNPKILDVGGLIVTVARLFSDIRFIARIKQEFIDSQFEFAFKGIEDEIDALYKVMN